MQIVEFYYFSFYFHTSYQLIDLFLYCQHVKKKRSPQQQNLHLRTDKQDITIDIFFKKKSFWVLMHQSLCAQMYSFIKSHPFAL